MTASPDSALRQALVAAETVITRAINAVAPFAEATNMAEMTYGLAIKVGWTIEHEQLVRGYAKASDFVEVAVTAGQLREAHALITEALQQHNHGAVE